MNYIFLLTYFKPTIIVSRHFLFRVDQHFLFTSHCVVLEHLNPNKAGFLEDRFFSGRGSILHPRPYFAFQKKN